MEYLSQGNNSSVVRFTVREKFSVLDGRICKGVSTEDADFEGTHAAQFYPSFNIRHYFLCQTKSHNFDQNFHT